MTAGATRAFNPGEKRDRGGRWTGDAAALEKLAATIRQGQVANAIIAGSATGTTARELDKAAAALRRGDRAGAEKILARLRGTTAAHKHLRKYHARVRHHHQRVIGPVEALMARAAPPRRGQFTSKPSLADTADNAAKLLGPDHEVPAHLRQAASAAGLKDYQRAGGHLAKARAALAGDGEAPAGTPAGPPDPAEHPKAEQRQALMATIHTHLRQMREQVGAVSRGLGWDVAELDLVRASHFDAKLHPRDRKGEFARKPGGGGRRPGPYGHVPAGMDTPNMRLAEAAGFVKAGKMQEAHLHPGGSRPSASPGADVRAGATPKRQPAKPAKTAAPGGTRPPPPAATVSVEQFTSAVDSLQKAIDAQRTQLDADHKAEIDALKQEITRAHDDAVTEIKAERKVFEKRKAVRKWINHIIALAAVALLTYMEAHGMHSGGGEATVVGVGGPILASIAAVGPLIVSEAVDLVKRL